MICLIIIISIMATSVLVFWPRLPKVEVMEVKINSFKVSMNQIDLFGFVRKINWKD